MLRKCVRRVIENYEEDTEQEIWNIIKHYRWGENLTEIEKFTNVPAQAAT